METVKLIEVARKAMAHAYAPYSRFPVGAALQTDSGMVYGGCNVENASLGLTMCAERTAVFKAVSEGERQFSRLALVASTPEFCAPCGACRQVLVEFAPEMEVIMVNGQGEYQAAKAKDLLPGYFAFSPPPACQEDRSEDSRTEAGKKER